MGDSAVSDHVRGDLNLAIGVVLLRRDPVLRALAFPGTIEELEKTGRGGVRILRVGLKPGLTLDDFDNEVFRRTPFPRGFPDDRLPHSSSRSEVRLRSVRRHDRHKEG